MSKEFVCTECGSDSLVSSGVFEHGTWIQRLTCWTCRDCQTVIAVPESGIETVEEPVDVGLTLLGPTFGDGQPSTKE